MSWNDGEVTVVPYQIKKPSYADDYWKPSWKANYKGEDFWIKKGKSEGYVVRWKWKGRHPKHDNAEIVPQLIDLNRLKTMPQVKKLIRTFVDGMNSGKIVDVETGKTLTFNTFDTCIPCDVYTGILNLYHRQNLFTHKYLWDRNESDKKHYKCKWHTKLEVIEAMKKDANTKLEDVDSLDIYNYKTNKGKKINPKHEIDVDALVPDSELIQMSNPYLEMARRRRGLEAEEENVVGKRIKRQGEHKKPDYELSYKGKTVKAAYHHTKHPMLRGTGYYSFYGIPELEGYNIVAKTIGIAKAKFKNWVNENIEEPVDVRLQMARRRRGLEAEGITTNPLLWAGATVLTLLTLFKRS